MKSKSTHGGRRSDSGRKPKPQAERYVKVLISLPPKLAAFIKTLPEGERSNSISNALAFYFKSEYLQFLESAYSEPPHPLSF